MSQSRALLHHPSRPHNRDPVGHFGDHAHVVGDQKDGRAEVGAKLAHELEDLSLDGDIQRSGRLVGDQHLWPARQRHRDHDALPHAARQLMRVLAHAPWGSVMCTASSMARARTSAPLEPASS